MGWIQPLHIILLGTALGVVYAFDMPARQALVHELVDTEDLANAVALNSSMINAARIVGPALAGLVVAKFGEGRLFRNQRRQLHRDDYSVADDEARRAPTARDGALFHRAVIARRLPLHAGNHADTGSADTIGRGRRHGNALHDA